MSVLMQKAHLGFHFTFTAWESQKEGTATGNKKESEWWPREGPSQEFSPACFIKRAQSVHHPSKAGMVPTRPEAEAARKLASLQDSHPPQQMQPHPNKRVWGQRRAKSLSHSHPPSLPQHGWGLKGARWHLGQWCYQGLGTGIFNLLSQECEDFLFPFARLAFGGEKMQTEHMLCEA